MMEQRGGIPTQTFHAHTGIEEAIDRAYIASVTNAAKARRFLHSPNGPIREIFLNFYTPFTALVEYTHQLESMKMKDDDLLKTSLLAWIDAGTGSHMTPAQIEAQLRVGLQLFRDYNGALIKRSVISVSRR